MNVTRREFVKAVAAAAVLPVASSTSLTSMGSVSRATMWAPDASSDETLARCNRLLAADPNDVLALVHRGQIPSIYFDRHQAWADLSRATLLEQENPCCYYIRGVCFDRAEDLQRAISLVQGREQTGKAICSYPDSFAWQGTEAGELVYISLRDLGYALEHDGRFDEAIAAYRMAAEFEAISPERLATWADASFTVESYCRAFVENDRLLLVLYFARNGFGSPNKGLCKCVIDRCFSGRRAS